MKRRQFLGLLGGTVLAAPLAEVRIAATAPRRPARAGPCECYITRNSSGYVVMETYDRGRTWQVWQTADDGRTWKASRRPAG